MKKILDSQAVKVGVVAVMLAGLVIAGRYGWQLQKEKYWQGSTGKNERMRTEEFLKDFQEKPE